MRGRGEGSRGFSLVELLVALVVLEVGLLGVVGTLLAAQRTLGAAEERETVAASVRMLVDSLERADAGGTGSVDRRGHTLEWTRTADATVRVRVIVEMDTLRFESGRPERTPAGHRP